MVMDRVGGYASYVALRADARAYEDVMLAMAAEAKARRIQKQRNERKTFGESEGLEPAYTWVNGEEPIAS